MTKLAGWLLLTTLLGLVSFPRTVAAHDDPIVTVRVMCNGFNVLDMDAVLGEISDAATLQVDRPVHGATEIQQWVRQQIDSDLRIEILDIGTPQTLSNGYTLAWTARFSRQDWRKAGIPSKELSNMVVIHNGRITEWTATVAATPDTQTSSAADTVAVAPQADSSGGMPELFGVPISLVLAGVIAIVGAVAVLRRSAGG